MAPKRKAKPKAKRGRRTVYKPEFCEIASRACMLGATNPEIAKSLGVATSTISKWIKERPEFSDAIKKGRGEADETVAISLYKRAIGYNHPDTKAQWVESDVLVDGVLRRVGRWEYADLTKHYPPDTGAMAIWLKNRRPDKWRDKPIDDNGISEPLPVQITIQVEDANKSQG